MVSLQRSRVFSLVFSLLGVFLLVGCREQLLEWCQQLKNEIQPSFSQSLENINQLLDVVLLYEEEDPPNRAASKAFTISVRTATQLALTSVAVADKICIKYLNSYKEFNTYLAEEIASSEKELRRSKLKLDQLEAEVKKRLVETKQLQDEIRNLNIKIVEANRQVERTQSEIKEQETKKKWWIVATVFTLGLATPGLLNNINSIKKLESERDGFQNEIAHRRNLLEEAERHLRELQNRKFASEQTHGTTQIKLSKLKTSLNRLHHQNTDVNSFGQRVREIYTLLAILKNKLKGIYTQQGIKTLLKPLTLSIDDLLVFLGDNVELVSLIGDKKVVGRIRKHLGQLLPERSQHSDVKLPALFDSKTGTYLEFQLIEEKANVNDLRRLTRIQPYERQPEVGEEEERKSWFKVFQWMKSTKFLQSRKSSQV